MLLRQSRLLFPHGSVSYNQWMSARERPAAVFARHRFKGEKEQLFQEGLRGRD